MGAENTSQSLGEFLRHEREQRGITLEQVVSATKIGIKALQALEADNYAELPATPFVRGFVKAYARFIGIDPKETLARFSDFMEKKAQDRPVRDEGHKGYAFERKEGEQSRTTLWVLLGGFTIVGGLAFVLLKPSMRHRSNPNVERLRQTHKPVSATPEQAPSPLAVRAPTPVPVSSSAPAPARVATAITTKPSPKPRPSPVVKPTPAPSVAVPANDPLNSGVRLKPSEVRYKIIFKALADVFVRYKSDDRPVMKFVLKKDKILVLRAKETIRFQASNAEAISVNYGGGYKVLKSEKNLSTRQGNPTLFFPAQLAETVQEPFHGESSLPKTSAPKSEPVSKPTTPLSTLEP